LALVFGSNPVTRKFAELFAEQRNPKSNLPFLPLQTKKQGLKQPQRLSQPLLFSIFAYFSPKKQEKPLLSW